MLKRLLEKMKKLAAEVEALFAESDQVSTALETAKDEDKKALEAKMADIQQKLEKVMPALEEAQKAYEIGLAKQKQLEKANRLLKAGNVPSLSDEEGDEDGDGDEDDELTGQRSKSRKQRIEGNDDGHKSLMKGFYEYCQTGGKKSMPFGVAEELTPKGAHWSADAAAGFIMPPLMKRLFLAGVTKTLPAISSSDGQGGYTMMDSDYKNTLLQMSGEAPFLLQNVTTVPVMNSDTVKWPKLVQSDSNEYGSISMTWLSTEGSALDDEEAAFEQLSISIHELGAYTEISQTLLRRSTLPLDMVIMRLFRDAMLYEINKKIISGSGTGEPYGILNTTGVHAVARAVANQVSQDDLVNVQYALQPYHMERGAFFIAHTAMQYLLKLKDTQNRPIFRPDSGTTRYPTIHGAPTTVNAVQPTLTSGNDGDVMYGDPSQYILAVDQDVVVKRSEDYQFKKAVASFLVYMAAGGKLSQPRAWAKLKASTS